MQALQPGDPRSVGQCRILARIRAGDTATVFLGRSADGRALAVKMPHPEVASNPNHRARLRQEVAAARAVGGRYGPAVVEADTDAVAPWVATEFLPAVSLPDVIRTYGPLPVGAVWPLATGVAEALFASHRAEVAHLDLTPANVLLTLDGPRLIGFGTARFTSEWAASQAQASDVYAFGGTLAFACTGTSRSGEESQWLAEIPDQALRALVTRCLNDDPAARPTVPEVVGHLLSVLQAGGAPDDGHGLPAAVVAEIERRGYEADNPPLPVPEADLPGGWRRVLVGAGAVALAGAVLALTSYLLSP